MKNRLLFAALAAASLTCAPGAHAAESVSAIIVKLKPSAEKARVGPAARLARVAEDNGVALQHVRTLAVGAELGALPHAVGVEHASAIAARIAADPAVEYAEADRRVETARVANDEFISAQGYINNGVS